jgi:uncharacterized membrane protein
VATVQESIEVEVPVTTAYNQWTQFESFPEFMEGVVSVRQLDDKHIRWVAEIKGHRREWTAEVTRQEPDRFIAWRSEDEREPDGVISFEPIDGRRTRVTVHMEYEPEGIEESVGSVLGIDDRRVKHDLERFKEMIESRREETGAWRGRIDDAGAVSGTESESDDVHESVEPRRHPAPQRGVDTS